MCTRHQRVRSGDRPLIDLARQESGGLLVGASGAGGYANREVAEASDVILIHGNGLHRQRYDNLIRQVQSWNLDGKPMGIACEEPFYPDYVETWIQKPIFMQSDDREFMARIRQLDGKVIEKMRTVKWASTAFFTRLSAASHN